MSDGRLLICVLRAIWRYISAASYTCRPHRAGLTGHPAGTQLAGPGSSTFLHGEELGKKSPELPLDYFSWHVHSAGSIISSSSPFEDPPLLSTDPLKDCRHYTL